MVPNKSELNPSNKWDESEERYRVYSKDEMEALQKRDASQFTTLSPWWIVGSQILATGLSALAWSFFGGPKGFNLFAQSAICGGLIGFLPSAVFVFRLQLAVRATKQRPDGFLAALVSGELLKIALTLALFIGLGLWGPKMEWLPLLVTYVVTIKCCWVACFWRK